MSVRSLSVPTRAGLALAAGGLAACLASDLSEYMYNSSGTFYEDPVFGVSITEFEEWGSSARLLPNGTVQLEGTALVTIEGRGAHEVWTIASVDPLSRGGMRSLATVDEATNEERVFFYSEVDNYVTIGDFDGGVSVYGNADGSYDVVTSIMGTRPNQDEYQHAEDGIAAWRLIQEYSEFTTASSYAVLMAYAMGQGPSLAARAPIDVGTGTSASLRADGPTICDLFHEFCVCALCNVSDTPAEQCSLCNGE